MNTLCCLIGLLIGGVFGFYAGKSQNKHEKYTLNKPIKKQTSKTQNEKMKERYLNNFLNYNGTEQPEFSDTE